MLLIFTPLPKINGERVKTRSTRAEQEHRGLTRSAVESRRSYIA
jgi:hypothetical protein